MKLICKRSILHFKNLPSSTSTTSTTAFSGISTLCVHIQFCPQLLGLLSPLQNCSGFMSSYCERGGAGAAIYEISSIKLSRWSPFGATIAKRKKMIKFTLLFIYFLVSVPKYLSYVFGANRFSGL